MKCKLQNANSKMQIANSKMQIAKCKLQIENSYVAAWPDVDFFVFHIGNNLTLQRFRTLTLYNVKVKKLPI